MFLIVPKPRPLPTNTDPGGSGNSKGQQTLYRSSATVFRGPTRVQNACDECRLRKVKCDGQQPCGRCRFRSAICVYDHAASRTSGPISPAQVAMLQSQQARLILALKNMSAVIDELKAHSSAETSMNMDCEDVVTDRLKAATHVENNNFDLTAILEVYAPCRSGNVELQQATSECASETENSRDGKSGSNKRRRQKQSPATTTMSAFRQVQAEVASSRENSPKSSCDAGMISQTALAERNSGPSSFVHVPDENSQITVDSSVNNPRATDPYSSFMEMLQSVRNSSAFTQQSADNACEIYLAGGSTAGGEAPDHGVSLPHPSLMRDSSILNSTQVDPLIDMVDWNASWENCAELLWNNQSLVTSEQEMSHQYELDWSL